MFFFYTLYIENNIFCIWFLRSKDKFYFKTAMRFLQSFFLVFWPQITYIFIYSVFDFCKFPVPSQPSSYGSWIYNYLCNRCLSPLMLWVRLPLRTRCIKLCDKVCQCLAAGRRFSLGPPVSSTNKTDRHDINEILLKVVLSTINQTTYCSISVQCQPFICVFSHYSLTWSGLF